MRRLLLLFIAFLGPVRFVRGSISATIPGNLIECYNDTYITTPDSLMPMTIETFISLLRKAERDPSSAFRDMRTMSSALLHSYRFDGIVPNPNVLPQAEYGVIPFTVQGPEFFLYRILFDSLLPDQGNYISNDTFTRTERCTLHRMLSLSVNPYRRPDNDGSCQTVNFNMVRRPRDLGRSQDVEQFDPKSPRMAGYQDYSSMVDPNYQMSECPLESGVILTSSGAVSIGLVLAGIATGLQPITVPQTNLLAVQPRLSSPKGRPLVPAAGPFPPRGPPRSRLFAQGYPSGQGYPDGYPDQGYPGQGYPSQGYPSQGYPGQGYPGQGFPGQGSPGDQGYPNRGYPSHGYPGQGSPGGQGGYPGSNNPWPPNRGFGNDGSIDNRWAHTVSGLLAESAVLSGPVNQMTIGADGGWNASVLPKYYFLKDNTPNAVSEARVRGALDGLIMAKNVNSWNSIAGNNLKLSQLFSMYYSEKGVFDPKMKGCNRKQSVTNAMPDADTVVQTQAFANIIKVHLPEAVQLSQDATYLYAQDAKDAAYYFINGRMKEPQCWDSSGGSFAQDGPRSVPAADLYFVVDCGFPRDTISNILLLTAQKALVDPLFSNITVITATTNTAINSTLVWSSQQSSDVYFNDTIYSSCKPGFDMPSAMNKLKGIFRDKLNWDRQVGTGAAYNSDIPRIVVFVPYQSSTVSDQEATYVKNTLQTFKTRIPDVKFLYLVSGSRDAFNQFTSDPKKDIISMMLDDIQPGIDLLIGQVSKAPRRLENPTCGAQWNGYSYSTMTLTENIGANEIQYFRIHPNYFFTATNAQILIQVSTGVATVCKSRNNKNPSRNGTSSNGAECQTVSGGSSYTIKLDSSSCNGASYAANCNPLYFSVQATAPASTATYAQCTDPTCAYPDMISYKITHQGLICYSSASIAGLSTMLMALLLSVRFLF